MNNTFKVGIDIGSTRVQCIRTFANILGTLRHLLAHAYDVIGESRVTIAMTGSAGMSLAKHLDVSFVQEVVATTHVLKSNHPEVDDAIELGGEDAKFVYLTNGVEQRMNGICAGGTGSFIDQMASLL